MKNGQETRTFGQLLYNKRMENKLGLREICRLAKYDPSNWSKIERGVLPPPSDEDTIKNWAVILNIKPGSAEHQDFIDRAGIACGIIPKGLNPEKMISLMPAFFRTVRNKKPSKEDLDKLIRLIKQSNE